ncbi:MAG: tetratricopeptide repeat protein [Rhodoluna sp.]|nr:tetratricopeptide repeat protein [Rhodoluna sp.]
MSNLNSSFSGAVDLSTLANKVVQDQLEQNGVKSDNALKVPAFAIDAEESIIRQIIQISSSVPVVVCFYSPADQDSVELKNKLGRLAVSGDGDWFLAKVDLIAQPALAQAFGVLEPATVAVILAGEPKPLFQGDQPEDDLATFINKLVDVAKSQGMLGKLVIGESMPEQPQLSQAEQDALDAMENGDFSAAVKIYEAELALAPGNELLAERLAQVRLVERTYQGDVEAELNVEPKDYLAAIRKADFYLAIGDSVSAFNLLLDWFSQTQGDERSSVSKHLLELFVVIGKNDPNVISARKLLAARMF